MTVWETMSNRFTPTPNEEKWRSITQGFNKHANFPNCVGTVDGNIKLETNRVIMTILLIPLMIISYQCLKKLCKILDIVIQKTQVTQNPTYYLSKISHNPFPNIKFNNTSTKEIEKLSNL
jgi:hypothetical protein